MDNVTEPILIARWPTRRDGTEARVQIKQYAGLHLIEVRTWWPDKAGEHQPGKGFSCGVRNLPALAKAIEDALAKARELGLVEGLAP